MDTAPSSAPAPTALKPFLCLLSPTSPALWPPPSTPPLTSPQPHLPSGPLLRPLPVPQTMVLAALKICYADAELLVHPLVRQLMAPYAQVWKTKVWEGCGGVVGEERVGGGRGGEMTRALTPSPIPPCHSFNLIPLTPSDRFAQGPAPRRPPDGCEAGHTTRRPHFRPAADLRP